MAKRRNIIVAFLLIAVLIMGIGYAELVDELTVTGQAGVTAFDADIYFKSFAEVKASDSAPSKFSTLTATDDSATMNVATGALKVAGDKAVAKFTIANDADYPVEITATPTVDAQTFFKVSVDWTDNKTTVAAHSTVDVTVTIEVSLMPTANDVAGTCKVTFNAEGKPQDYLGA